MKFGHGLLTAHHCAGLELRAGRAAQRSTLLLIVILSCIGCAKFKLPAIDPNGSSIFLPHPNSTQLLHGKHSGGLKSCIPTPAYSTPNTPPPCLDGGESKDGWCNLHKRQGHLAAKQDRRAGKKGEIQLSPMLVVAPLGGEVVLRAGICGEDGYLVTRQPIEWMLSPQSVGTFIAVGDDKPGKLARLLRYKDPKVEKLDVDFARGRTSSKETMITRGTPRCDDDITLRTGETWLSISSPREGVSHVTVLAPESDLWDQRRQTATIYWLDAHWQFPTPTIENSGETVSIFTRVTKSDQLVPAQGWQVKYTILDPSVATFADAGAVGNELVSVVDADGKAYANLRAGPSSRGTTPVAIEVIRPDDPDNRLPQLTVGRGSTTVTFSSPALAVQAFGPAFGAVGEQVTYNAILANPGDLDVENARLTLRIPEGWAVVQTIPEASGATPTGRIWEQGTLAAGRQLDVQVTLQAGRAQTYEVVFEGVGEPTLGDRASVVTEIVASSVDLKFEPVGGVAQAEIGGFVDYDLTVTNTGPQTLTDVKILIESSPGLLEKFQQLNRVEQTLSYLGPGETQRLPVSFQVQQEGQHSVDVRVERGNALLAQKSSAVAGIQPRPKQPGMAVEIQFPETIQVGSRNTARILLRNTGEVTLKDIQVQLTFDRSIRPEKVDVNNIDQAITQFSPDRSTALWTPKDLFPRVNSTAGDPYWEMLVDVDSIATSNAGSITAQARSAENVTADATARFRAIDRQVVPPATPPSGQPAPPAQRSGNLRLVLNSLNNPTYVGNPTRFALTVVNDQNMLDQNIRVRLQLTQGAEIQRVSTLGATQQLNRDTDGWISLPVIQSARPGERLDYTVVVMPNIPHTMVLQAQVVSAGQPNVIRAAAETTVTLGN